MQIRLFRLAHIVAVALIPAAVPAQADEAAERKQAEKMLAEDLELLARDDHCGAKLSGSIDWSSFGSATHKSEDGRTSFNIGGYCRIDGPLSATCQKHGRDVLVGVKRYRCAYQKGGTERLDKDGVDLQLKGDTLTLLVNLRGYNQDLRVAELLPQVLTVEVPGGRVTVEERFHRRVEEKALADDTELLAQENRCGAKIESSIDWDSFGTALHRTEDGRSLLSIGGYCMVQTYLDAFCQKHGSATVRQIRKLRCVYKKAGNRKVDELGWDLQRSGDTLTVYTNLRGANAHIHLPRMLPEVLKPARR